MAGDRDVESSSSDEVEGTPEPHEQVSGPADAGAPGPAERDEPASSGEATPPEEPVSPEESAVATLLAEQEAGEAEEETSDGAPADGLEVTRAALAVWRVALVLLMAATLVGLIAIGSEGRAASAWRSVRGAVGDVASAFDRATGEVASATGSQLADWTTAFQDVASLEPEPGIGAVEDAVASFLLVVTDDSGAAQATALFATTTQDEPIVVLFPPSLLTTVPGYGDFPLLESTRFEDADLAAVTVSNMLGVRVDASAQLAPGDLSRLVGTSVDVDLPRPLVIPDGEGSTVLADAGPSSLAPALLEAAIATQGEDDELGWLERQGAAWDALLDAMRDRPELLDALADTAVPSDAAATALAAAASSDRVVAAVPLRSLGIGDTERFSLPREESEAFVAQRMGELMIRPDEPRPRVEVLNGNGRTGTTRLVAATLIRNGFEVMRTDNADSFDYPATRVIAHGRENRPAGAEAVELLEVGVLELELRTPSGVVDLSIIVGDDIPTGEG